MKFPGFIFTLTVSVCLLGGCAREPDRMVGTLERDRIELRVETDEPILAVLVRDGARVAAGDRILQQDPARAQARLQHRQAQRDQAAARLAELRRGPREEAIREAQARLQASEVVSHNAQTEFERAQDLFDRDLSDASTRDSAQTRWYAARASAQADREALAALLSGTTVEELLQAQAALAAAEAQVDQARLDLERHVIYAPVNGVVDKVLYETGERPAVGSTVAVMLDERRTYARIYVPEPLRAQVTPGMQLGIDIDGTGETFTGTVTWVSADASFTPYFALTEHDRSRLSYLAEVDLEGAERLPAGVPLDARLPSAGRP